MADFNSSLPIRTESAGDAIVKVADATTPSQQLKVESDGSINVNGSFSLPPGSEIKITDGTDDLAVNGDGSINAVVTSTNLDIRDLSAAQDNVAISDGTDSLAINADGSINITDNGGSITVDGSVTVTASDLDIRNLSATQDNVSISDGTDALQINADGSLNAVVSATNLDIRDLSASTDSVAANIRDESGNAFSNTNPLPVSIVDVEGTEINNYDTTASVAGGASDNHDYTATGAFKLRNIFASASGKLRIEVQIETGAATNTFNTAFVAFNSTSSPNIQILIKDAITVVSGARVRVIRTNRDNQSQDVYSTISGFLV